jgi:excisionase family DNA binding protein
LYQRPLSCRRHSFLGYTVGRTLPGCCDVDKVLVSSPTSKRIVKVLTAESHRTLSLAGIQRCSADSTYMNEQLTTIPDYQAAIYQTLLRIERSLIQRSLMIREPDRVPTTAHAKPTMSMNDAARYLGVGRSSLYELVRSRQIRSVRVGRRILIPSNALDAYIADERAD